MPVKEQKSTRRFGNHLVDPLMESFVLTKRLIMVGNWNLEPMTSSLELIGVGSFQAVAQIPLLYSMIYSC
jgi:hypothetical protein